MASRYTHIITPIHSDLARRLDASCGPAETHQSSPIETTFETTAKNAGAQPAA